MAAFICPITGICLLTRISVNVMEITQWKIDQENLKNRYLKIVYLNLN